MSAQSAIRSLRYVVLWHSGIAEPHFDFMVETRTGSELAAWRSPTWPVENQQPWRRLKDHRRVYLDFEGELTGHRGHVQRVASGLCSVEIEENSVWLIGLEIGGLRASFIRDNDWRVEPF